MVGVGDPSAQEELPVKKDPKHGSIDKNHCLSPNVWIRGKCIGDPRGTKTDVAERNKACSGGEKSKPCIAFKQKEVSVAMLNSAPFRVCEGL